MYVSALKENDLTNEVIDKILYQDLEERGLKGDCIMVLESVKATQYRVPKAASIPKSPETRWIIKLTLLS